ncbi:hypothetical protein KKC08_00220 [Patescibacteria group bacterium]|nr:hypothetical protein [Patescibacteria group bacterium]MCG2701685.1 hypothetical protein [Candidatus Parcubacteria bacterium]MBU4210081.1 hypothetical protein [Patescibacteria group bacterium]MBU4265380.1 hypothetical protein [Patescibacteria group bacterium]MBU4390332.1 hypothetical protein [Patescibacteria group bacterium]
MKSDPLKIAIKGSTQEHLPIEDVIDGIVILKNGSCALVMQLSSVNFDLLSEREQSALVFAYGGILNSLTFPIQIVIRSNTKDVSLYLEKLKNAEFEEHNPLLKDRIRLYRAFIEETVRKNDVLSKSFYVVVPFSLIELGIQTADKTLFSGMNPLKKSQKLPYNKEYILEKAMASLEPKRDHVMRLFSRLGLEIKPLDTRELVQLFYKIYNEESFANQKIQSLNYVSPIVTTKK